MTRRVKVTITAEAMCDDDRWLSRDIACAARDVASRSNATNGVEPYYYADVVQVRNSVTPDVTTVTYVKVTYVARFLWWHFLVPARFVRGSRDPLGWLRR